MKLLERVAAARARAAREAQDRMAHLLTVSRWAELAGLLVVDPELRRSIGLFGTIAVEIDAELAQLDETGRTTLSPTLRSCSSLHPGPTLRDQGA